MSRPTDNYWVQWRSYSRKQDGCCTHATEMDTNTALCGVETLDGAGQTLTATNGVVGCKRCQSILRKRGIIPSND